VNQRDFKTLNEMVHAGAHAWRRDRLPHAPAHLDLRRSRQASNRVAQALRAQGIGAGDRVAALTRHDGGTLTRREQGRRRVHAGTGGSRRRVEYIVSNGEARLLMVDARRGRACAPARVALTGHRRARRHDRFP
jgi:non-ribosomal peptide synthetase component F